MSTLSQSTIGSNKAIASVIGGAATVILVYILNQLIKTPLPAEVAGAIQVIVTTAAVWLVPHGGDA